MRIGIVGVGHVGGALGTFLNEHHEVIGIDLSVKKASFPIYKDYAHLKDVDIVFIAVPTLYNNDYEALDTSLVEDAVKEVIK